eukprot:5458290-Amphidinium_carterae.1
MGPARQSQPFPLELLKSRDMPEGPLVDGGPVSVHVLLVLGCHCLLREIEEAALPVKTRWSSDCLDTTLVP